MIEAVLITTFNANADPVRLSEYNKCLKLNSQCDNIAKIVLFFEGSEDDIHVCYKHRKIETIVIDKIPTFNQIFDHANKNFKGQYVIIANADIYFDGESNLNRIVEMRKSSMWVLTRYDYVSENQYKILFRSNHGSYDTFIFRSPLKEFDWKYKLKIAISGVETYLVSKAIQGGIPVANPAKSIISKHLHLSPIRKHVFWSEKYENFISYHDLPDYYKIMRKPRISTIEEEKYLMPLSKFKTVLFNLWRTIFYNTRSVKILKFIKYTTINLKAKY